jgi:hypothetical protein
MKKLDGARGPSWHAVVGAKVRGGLSMKFSKMLLGAVIAASLVVSTSPVFAGSMTWAITDGCPNGEEIRYRFFTESEDWQWPGPGQYFVTNRYNETYRSTITCRSGDKICYGAWQPGRNNYWGVGEFGDGVCEGCCARCDGEVHIRRLTC